MGFCRRCGDIVAGARCQCGGTSVAPVIAWKNFSSSTNNQDRWSKTYVSSQGSTGPAFDRAPNSSPGIVASASNNSPASNNSTRRFPRPLSSFAPLKSLKNGVSDHITLATSQSARPPSPLKMSTTLSDAENDILPSFLPHEPTLSKVYGSLLQPKDTLTLHSCARCSTIFPPDATIYPDPSPSNSNSFLCRNCFTTSGGSKGSCPACSRPVLALKAEGGFVHSGGKYWHKRCYNCAGCFKNIGDTPMVDLLGRPSCVECFDNCLKSTTPKKDRASNNNSPNISNPGGLNANYGRKSRESSPAIEELEQRLGLMKSRESSPATMDPWNVSAKLDSLSNLSPNPKPHDVFGEDSPNQSSLNSLPSLNIASPKPMEDSPDHGVSRQSNSPNRSGNSVASLSKSFIGEPARMSPSNRIPGVERNSYPDSSCSPGMKQSAKSNQLSANPGMATSVLGLSVTMKSACGKCAKPILNPREGGQFVTVPGADENAIPQLYHAACFKCVVCDKPFSDVKTGQASFVKADAGPCHTQCAPAEHFVVRRSVSTKSWSSPHSMGPPKISLPTSNQSINTMPPPSTTQRPFVIPQSPSKLAFSGFAGQNACPGCQKSVSVMERGVVPGPQGTRWHASCLVCGGKKETTRATLLGRSREERKGEPGCGKKLDSAAKSDGEGRVWCRECLLLLGNGGSPQASPIRSLLAPSFTGSTSPTKVAPQFTGITRQSTGMGGSDAILRQLTGGGLSPTRSISPTKQLGMMGAGGGVRPRPKSVIGMRSTRSVDEGRGMYLVRQFTGASMNGGTG